MIDSVIDPIIDAIHRADNLTAENKEKAAELVANSGHEALRYFLYGIEDEPVGIEILYQGTVINDQSFEMPAISRELDLVEFSRYDDRGALKSDFKPQ